MKHRILHSAAAAGALVLAACACGPADGTKDGIDLTRQAWSGNAICYSGYRAGQHPDLGLYPSQGQILEDMRLLERHWNLIRTYGADRHAEDILEVLQREKIPIKVMLGAWLALEPGNEASNRKQVSNAIRLANAYPGQVAAVSVGNEILVSWSNHKVPEDIVTAYVRQVRDSVDVPVTVDDDFTYWREGGAKLAAVVDFVALHTYPMWGGVDIDSALAVTVAHFESVKKALPGKTLVIGEAGWASYTVGPQHAPRAGDEEKQMRYFGELTAWAKKEGVNVFFFEAFDEPWKGAGTEGHWGLFSEGRKAKRAMREWYPDRLPDGPTSPAYE